MCFGSVLRNRELLMRCSELFLGVRGVLSCSESVLRCSGRVLRCSGDVREWEIEREGRGEIESSD